jgi:tetratricopeptide (TPR) repeat protein
MSGGPPDGRSIGPHVISYSRVDASDDALRLCDELASGPPPFLVWIDQRDLAPGLPWDDEVHRAIRGCESLLFLVTADSVDPSSICHDEWNLALQCKKLVIPLLFQRDVEPPWRLARRQWIDFTADRKAALAALRDRLREVAAPQGRLRAAEDRLADARRDRSREPDPSRRARIEAEIVDIEREVDDWRRALDDTRTADQRVEDRLEADRALEQQRVDVQAPAPTVPTIGALPTAPPWYFEDRAEENEILTDFLREPSTRLVIVAGPTGMGKTAMVCCLLDHVEQRRLPDGEAYDVDGLMYVTLGASQQLTLATLLQGLTDLLPEPVRDRLRLTLGNPDASAAHRMGELLVEYRHRRVIVFLDGLEHLLDPATQQLREFDLHVALRTLLRAPQHGVKLIITTSIPPRPLMQEQPDRIGFLDRLAGLPSPYAENLLRRLDKNGAYGLRDADGNLLAEARRRTRGRPKALIALFHWLRNDRRATLPKVLEDTEGLLPEQVTKALVGEAFDHLDRPAQLAVQALAIYPGPVRAGAVDYLLHPFKLGISADRLLDRLVNTYLVTERDGRYLLEKEERNDALHRIPRGEPRDRDARPVPFTRFALLHWAAEYCHQAGAVAGAARSRDDLDSQLMELELRYQAEEFDRAAHVLLLDQVARRLSRWGHSRLVANHCERLEGRLTDPQLAYRNAATLGLARWRLGEHDLAVLSLERARRLARDLLQDPRAEGRALGNLAGCHFELGQVQLAASQYKETLALARRVGDRQAEADAIVGYAICHDQTGDLRAALRRYGQALRIAVKLDDRSQEAAILANLGSLQADLGDGERGLETLRRGLKLAVEADDLAVAGSCRSKLAEVHVDLQELDPAIEQAREAAEIGGRTRRPRAGLSLREPAPRSPCSRRGGVPVRRGQSPPRPRRARDPRRGGRPAMRARARLRELWQGSRPRGSTPGCGGRTDPPRARRQGAGAGWARRHRCGRAEPWALPQ